MLNEAGVVGIRLNLIGKPDPAFDQDDWRALLRQCGRSGMAGRSPCRGPAAASDRRPLAECRRQGRGGPLRPARSETGRYRSRFQVPALVGRRRAVSGSRSRRRTATARTVSATRSPWMRWRRSAPVSAWIVCCGGATGRIPSLRSQINYAAMRAQLDTLAAQCRRPQGRAGGDAQGPVPLVNPPTPS